jgi:hypothetical protein
MPAAVVFWEAAGILVGRSSDQRLEQVANGFTETMRIFVLRQARHERIFHQRGRFFRSP